MVLSFNSLNFYIFYQVKTEIVFQAIVFISTRSTGESNVLLYLFYFQQNPSLPESRVQSRVGCDKCLLTAAQYQTTGR